MEIVIIGSGNVAYHLAKALKKENLPLIQIFGRNSSALSEIAQKLEVPYSTEELQKADLYIICVSDSSIEEVSKKISNPKALVVHTSGSLPMEVLQGNYRKGSFYPLQTFSREKELDFKEIPLFVESQNPKDTEILLNLAKNLSKHVQMAHYEQRKYIHLTAVFSCNFVNHLIARAKEISDTHDLPFEYFLPLIKETFSKIETSDPKEVQTGPARRGDTRVLKLHEELIHDPLQKKLYQILNQSIQEMYGLDQ